MTSSVRILLVDDDHAFRTTTAAVLRQEGWEVEFAESAEEGLVRFGRSSFDAVLSDLVMDGVSGLEFLRQVRAVDPHIPMVMVTGYGSIDTAVEAMKLGATDYVSKPYHPEELKLRLKRAIQSHIAQRRAQLLEQEFESSGRLDELIGESRAMEEVFRLARRVAETDTTVLILGETGTGKGLLAKAIHLLSLRKSEPFVSVNCAALAPTLLESELFGHEKGSFTGALARRKGRFELAERGTLFLDEIGELNLDLQTKLLHVVEERKFERVGGTETLSADVRLIAATNRNLADTVRAGKFREDLYFRLNIIPITIPPLRERLQDIAVLAHHFLRIANEKTSRNVQRISSRAMQSLLDYSWPGNVRELENTVERAVIMSEGNEVSKFVFEKSQASGKKAVSLDRSLKDIVREQTIVIEKEYITNLLIKYRGNVSKTSEHAQIDRRTLFEKMKLYGLRKEDFK